MRWWIPLVPTLAACLPTRAMEGDYTGQCATSDFDVGIELFDVEYNHAPSFSGTGSWILFLGRGELSGVLDEPMIVSFASALCHGDDCEEGGRAHPEGTALGYIDWNNTGERVLVLEGTEGDDGSWSGTCWYTQGGTAQGTYLLDRG